MRLRTFFLTLGTLSLLAAGGCDDEHHSDTDAGEHDHDDHDHDSGHSDEDAGASCSQHADTAPACDEEIDTVGATVTLPEYERPGPLGQYNVLVTAVVPGDLEAGGDEFMLMLRIVDAAEEPVEGVTLNSVFTEAHGGHESCGAPELMYQGNGMYHLHGLAYPHSGTWHHELMVDGETIDLALCVAAAE